MLPAALAVLVLVVPLVAMVAATDWATLPAQLASEPLREALRLSIVTSTAAMLVCLVLGLPVAWLLARVAFRGRGVLRALVTVPLVLPPVVAGIALRNAFGRTGVIGRAAAGADRLRLPLHHLGRRARPRLRVPALRRASRSRAPCAPPTRCTTPLPRRWAPPGGPTFRRVTVPLAMPGILAGMVLGWSRSLGEFGATITFNGNYPGTTQTMPTLIYVTRQSDQDAAQALSLVMLALSLAVLLLLRDRWLGGRGSTEVAP